MKNLLFVIVALAFFSCDNDKIFGKQSISKAGDMTIESVENIIFKYNLYDYYEEDLHTLLKYSDDSELNQPRLGIHVTGTSRGIIVLCSSKKSYDTSYGNTYENFSLGFQLEPIEDNEYEEQAAHLYDERFHIYFDIEILQEMGIISLNSEIQEDLCFFDEYTSSGSKIPSPTTHSSTKRLRYKAEEINKIMQQYRDRV